MGCSRINYGERLDFLPGCDLVVSATASPNYTLTKEQVEGLRLKKQIIFIDLAVPRDMSRTREIEGVELYTIDDFKPSTECGNIAVHGTGGSDHSGRN